MRKSSDFPKLDYSINAHWLQKKNDVLKKMYTEYNIILKKILNWGMNIYNLILAFVHSP